MKICLAIHCLYGLIRTFFILTKSKTWGSTLSESWRIKFMNEWWSWTQTSTMSLLLSGSFSGREGQELFDKIRQVVPWYFSCYSLSPKLPNYNYKLYKKSITVFTGKGKKKIWDQQMSQFDWIIVCVVRYGRQNWKAWHGT